MWAKGLSLARPKVAALQPRRGRRTTMHKGVELVIFMGLQGAGKSTFYRERFATTHAHVSLDRLRNSTSRPRHRQSELVAQALAAGQSVVVDNTSPGPADRAPLIALGRDYGAAI